jgi:hypothetical protein
LWVAGPRPDGPESERVTGRDLVALGSRQFPQSEPVYRCPSRRPDQPPNSGDLSSNDQGMLKSDPPSRRRRFARAVWHRFAIPVRNEILVVSIHRVSDWVTKCHVGRITWVRRM